MLVSSPPGRGDFSWVELSGFDGLWNGGCLGGFKVDLRWGGGG